MLRSGIKSYRVYSASNRRYNVVCCDANCRTNRPIHIATTLFLEPSGTAITQHIRELVKECIEEAKITNEIQPEEKDKDIEVNY